MPFIVDNIWKALQDCRPDLVLEALRMQPSRVNYSDMGTNLLHEAVALDSVELTEYCLAHGVDPEAQARFGGTALTMAARFHDEKHPNNQEIIRILNEHGVDLYGVDTNGYTAMGEATMRDNPEQVKILAELGVDIYEPAQGTSTPMDLARIHDKVAVIEALCQLGVDPSSADDQISAPQMMDYRQPISHSDALIEYVRKIRCINVEGEVMCQDASGASRRRRLSGRMFIKNYCQNRGILLASDPDSLATAGDDHPFGDAGNVVCFLWPPPDEFKFHEDSFSVPELDFQYVAQPILPAPLSATEMKQQMQAEADRVRDEKHWKHRDAVAASKMREKPFFQNRDGTTTPVEGICTTRELLVYCEEVAVLYVTGECGGRQFHKTKVNVDFTNKYVWLEDDAGFMVQILRPSERDIQFQVDGFSMPGLTVEYSQPPSSISSVARTIRYRRNLF
ncbi:MAG: hypothetical protein JWL77_3518 [Chthonomonadaceae bacterium]|nr:hypothetical protein [Chthonomonadaceae bacterium]